MLLSTRYSIAKLIVFATISVLCFQTWHTWPTKSSDVAIVLTPPIATPPSVLIPVTTTTIPEKIWYKLGPRGLSDECRAWTDTCITKNPSYQVEFLTDESGDAYVRDNFASRPDIIKTYLALSIPILKADMLRYLLLYHQGGIWNDLDISCGDVPMGDWVSPEYKNDSSVVVGLEFDVGWGTAFTRQFASWTVMAKPGSQHLIKVIDDILASIDQKAKENNVSVSELGFDMIGDVVDLTGPRRMTRSLLESVGTMLGETIDERNISLVLEPRLIGDVLVLPGYSFGAGSNRYEEGQVIGPPLVTHHYAGTWKNQHGGEVDKGDASP
jgi:alpha 1,6-mannosyltransferase